MTEKEMKEYIIEALEWYKNNVTNYMAISSDYVVEIETDYRKKQYESILWEIDRLKRGEKE